MAGREHGTLHFYRKYGSKIVEKYRGESRQVIDRDVRIRCSSIGFNSEWLFTLVFQETNFTPPEEYLVIRRKDVPLPAGIEPTFREFVQYLIHTDLANYGDDHWIPYYLYCTPCLVDYDVIAKVKN